MDDIQAMRGLLSEDDERMLRDIYEPTVVCAHPEDTRRSLCVLPDGEIRSYGQRWNETRSKHERIYLASRDCGLSWKMYYDHSEMGAAVRLKSGRWVKIKNSEESGCYALLSQIGPDDPSPRRVDISPISFTDPFPVNILKNGRIICTMHSDDGGVQHPVLAISDDEGESWTLKPLPTTPPFTVHPPHKGLRWQNQGGEPTLTELKDGTLVMLERTSLDYSYVVFSHDGGDNWSEPVPSRFHATLTTPAWLKMSDGRLLLFWNNTQPLPEQDHEKQFPPADDRCKQGLGEDVFTNRDANHAAIFDDTGVFNPADFTLEGEGARWTGFRELYLNSIRCAADFRATGSLHDSVDKSVQQFQAIELPFGKVLLQFGQNITARRTVIFDPQWLYDGERHENFFTGLDHVSTQVYIRSYNGCSAARGYPGHCAYNRTNGAMLVPSPELEHREVMLLRRTDDEMLFSNVQGAVWNFPSAQKGHIELETYIKGGPLRVSLSDRWFNPIDESVETEAPLSFTSELKKRQWLKLSIDFDGGKAKVSADGKDETTYTYNITKNGLSYLHLQNAADSHDPDGVMIRSITFTAQ